MSNDEESRLRKVITAEFSFHLPEFDLPLNTGLRRSEQYGLTWPNVDFANKVLTIPRSKHGGIRHVPLNSIALAMLEFLRDRSEKSEYVFLSVRDEHALTQNRHWFEDAVKKASIRDFTWHCLRHTFASRLVMAGVDIRTVAELMGHKTLQMTRRYAHLAPQHLADAVERLATSATRSATEQHEAEQDSSVAVN